MCDERNVFKGFLPDLKKRKRSAAADISNISNNSNKNNSIAPTTTTIISVLKTVAFKRITDSTKKKMQRARCVQEYQQEAAEQHLKKTEATTSLMPSQAKEDSSKPVN